MRQQQTKRKIAKVAFSSNDEQAVNYIIRGDDFKSLFYNIVIDAIKDNYQNDKCILFNVPNISNDVIIEKSNYQKALNESNKFFIDREDYDKCCQIRDILQKL